MDKKIVKNEKPEVQRKNEKKVWKKQYEKSDIEIKNKILFDNKRCLSCGTEIKKNKILCKKCKKKLYQVKYYRKKIRKTKLRKRHTRCIVCGSKDRVRPFTGLCENHFLQERRKNAKDYLEFSKFKKELKNAEKEKRK